MSLPPVSCWLPFIQVNASVAHPGLVSSKDNTQFPSRESQRWYVVSRSIMLLRHWHFADRRNNEQRCPWTWETLLSLKDRTRPRKRRRSRGNPLGDLITCGISYSYFQGSFAAQTTSQREFEEPVCSKKSREQLWETVWSLRKDKHNLFSLAIYEISFLGWILGLEDSPMTLAVDVARTVTTAGSLQRRKANGIVERLIYLLVFWSPACIFGMESTRRRIVEDRAFYGPPPAKGSWCYSLLHVSFFIHTN